MTDLELIALGRQWLTLSTQAEQLYRENQEQKKAIAELQKTLGVKDA